ncbi:hypothetical protein THTE_1590 [Thermogutta terrifontis]|uniref:Uncharacterized protein n=1 Tax=Thermogutta terrifontis TaxID=1331910 RepID=A0A286RE18_9BACT|nr:hypothetical protein THTE_1590 [Thermogutta terrifontis]
MHARCHGQFLDSFVNFVSMLMGHNRSPSRFYPVTGKRPAHEPRMVLLC